MGEYINLIDVIRGTTVDGPGFRTSFYFAGCRHECPGCHNPQSWAFDSGAPYSLSQILEIIQEEDFDVTLTGGDPLYHPSFIRTLIKNIKDLNHTIWIYTGFTWEQIISTPLIDAISEADVVVDSPFIMNYRDPDLLFRGSSNQRIIDIQASIANDNKIIIWERQ